MQEITLTKGYVTFVDDEDYESLAAHKWHVLDGHPWHRYAARWKPGSKPRQALRMHHVILGIDSQYLREEYLVVDHIDRDGLNNQRDNLRVTTRSVNAYNSERSDNAIGIYWDTVRLRYKTFILQPKTFIGWFKSFDEAAAAQEAYRADN